MNAFVAWLLALAIFGNSLLFWPIYRLFHPCKTKRRQHLLEVFLIFLASYTALTGFVLYGVYHINDFHHAILLVYAAYIVLDVGCWIASLSAFERDENYEH